MSDESYIMPGTEEFRTHLGELADVIASEMKDMYEMTPEDRQKIVEYGDLVMSNMGVGAGLILVNVLYNQVNAAVSAALAEHEEAETDE